MTAPMFDKVLVAVDDSPAALAAARAAVDIAARTGAHLRFVHVTSDGEIVQIAPPHNGDLLCQCALTCGLRPPLR